MTVSACASAHSHAHTNTPLKNKSEMQSMANANGLHVSSAQVKTILFSWENYLIPNDTFLCDRVESAINSGSTSSTIPVRKGGAKIVLHCSGCTKLDGERLEWRGAGAVVVGGHGGMLRPKQFRASGFGVYQLE